MPDFTDGILVGVMGAALFLLPPAGFWDLAATGAFILYCFYLYLRFITYRPIKEEEK